MLDLPDKGVRIGYTRFSDQDCVSSAHWLPGALRDQFINELEQDNDVKQAWWRDAANEVHYFIDVPDAARVHTCYTQHPDDPTACLACVEDEEPMLVCSDCGEAFDEIIPAYAHTTTDKDGLPVACGLDFRMMPRVEAM